MIKITLRRMAFMSLACALLPGTFLFPEPAAAPKETREKKGAELFKMKGHTRHWKDTDKTPLDQKKGPRKMRSILNFEQTRPLTRIEGTNDPVVQKSYTTLIAGDERTEPLIPTPNANFAGMNFNAHGAGWPPDTCGDVGLNHYVQGVNTSIGIFDKSTGAMLSATTFDSFFDGPAVQGTPCDNDNNGDPIVLYDRYAQRWIILDFAWDPSEADGSWFSVAASKTSDPTGEWWIYAFRADNALMNDYPKAGVWNDGIYITANMFQFSGSFQGVKIWALKKPDIYNGTLTAQSLFDNAYEAWSILPSHAKGATPPASGTPNYMYALDADEYGAPGIDAIYMWKYAVDWSNPANTTWTGPQTLTTAPFVLSSARVPQMGTTNQLDSLYGRLMNPAISRNFGSHESAYLCHVCDYNNLRAMRWYEIRVINGVPSIYQQGTYAPDSSHRWMGSIAANKNGDIAMGYSVSSSAMYPAIRYAGRLAGDPTGVMAQGEASLQNGAGYQSFYTRWGDYSAISIDPTDDETFWYTQEYYSASGTNWQTRIGAFKIEAVPAPSLATALDNPSLTVTTSGNAQWTGVTDVFQYGGSSCGSGAIADNQSTSMETTISGKTQIKFYWKVSSQSKKDYLWFYIDGVKQAGISGEANWAQKTWTVTSGTHTLKWTYIKDRSKTSGSDRAWVDKLELQ